MERRADDRLGIESRAVRHLDCTDPIAQRNGQRVVAHHPHRRRHRHCGQRPIAGRRQKQIAIDYILALEDGRLAGPGQGPELAPGLEHPGRLQLIAGNLRQIPVELQHLTGLHHLVAAADNR